jgi:hypothetical protein
VGAGELRRHPPGLAGRPLLAPGPGHRHLARPPGAGGAGPPAGAVAGLAGRRAGEGPGPGPGRGGGHRRVPDRLLHRRAPGQRPGLQGLDLARGRDLRRHAGADHLGRGGDGGRHPAAAPPLHRPLRRGLPAQGAAAGRPDRPAGAWPAPWGGSSSTSGRPGRRARRPTWRPEGAQRCSRSPMVRTVSRSQRSSGAGCSST